MFRIAGYVAGLAACAFILGSRQLVPDAKATTMAIAFFIALVAFPIGCVLDFLGRGKRVLPRIPFWLLISQCLLFPRSDLYRAILRVPAV